MVGPTVRDGAIVLDHLDGVHDLPAGWTDEQEAGHYRLSRRGDGALFGWAVGAHSWRQFLFPPRSRLWRAEQTGTDGGPIDFQVVEGPEAAPRLRLRRRALVRRARHRRPGRGVPPRGPSRPDLPRPSRGRVHRRRPLRRAGQHLLLHVDGHRAAGPRRLRPRAHRAARRSAPRVPARRGLRAGRRAAAATSRPAGRGGRPRGLRGGHRPRRAEHDPPRADRRHPRPPRREPGASSLGRRGGTMPVVHQLHAGVPDVLLLHRRGRHRSRPASRPSGGGAGTPASRSTTPTCTAAASGPTPASATASG